MLTLFCLMSMLLHSAAIVLVRSEKLMFGVTALMASLRSFMYIT